VFPASKELLSAFQSFVADPKLRALVAVIEKESIVPGETIPTIGTFLGDLEQLRDVLTTKRPAYVLLRRYDDEIPAFVPVTYMPDGATVSQKTLFASTKDTFLRQLGTEKFGRPLFATEIDDLLDGDFWGMNGAMYYSQPSDILRMLMLDSPAPLTQEEQSSKELRDAEISTGSNFRRAIVSTGLAPPISEEAIQALKEIRPGGFVNLVQLVVSCVTNRACPGTDIIPGHQRRQQQGSYYRPRSCKSLESLRAQGHNFGRFPTIFVLRMGA
jgi:twinfilin-like protein